MMGSAFDSFDESPLGGFVESPLGARGLTGGEQGDLFIAVHRSSGSTTPAFCGLLFREATWSIATFDAATSYGITIGGVTVSVAGTVNEATTTSALLAALQASSDPGFAALNWRATIAGSASSITGKKLSSFTATNYTSGGAGTLNAMSSTTRTPSCVFYDVSEAAWRPADFEKSLAVLTVYDFVVYQSRLYALCSDGIYYYNGASNDLALRWTLITSSGDLTLGAAIVGGELYFGGTSSLNKYDGSTFTNGLALPSTFDGSAKIRRIAANADGSALCAVGDWTSAPGTYSTFAYGLPGAWTVSQWYASDSARFLTPVGQIGDEMIVGVNGGTERFASDIGTPSPFPTGLGNPVPGGLIAWDWVGDTLSLFGRERDGPSTNWDPGQIDAYGEGAVAHSFVHLPPSGDSVIVSAGFINPATGTAINQGIVQVVDDSPLEFPWGGAIDQTNAYVLCEYGEDTIAFGGLGNNSVAAGAAFGLGVIAEGAEAVLLGGDGFGSSDAGWQVTAMVNIGGVTLV